MFNDLITSFFLAGKSIQRGNKGTLVLTILMMTLAFVNLIFLSSIFTGMVVALDDQAVNNIYGNIVIEPEEDELYIKQVNSKQRLIDSVPGVSGSSAHYIDLATFSYDEFKDGKDIKNGKWLIKSIDPDFEKQVTTIYQTIVAGEYIDSLDRDQIVLGRDVSGGYGSTKGDQSLGQVDIGDEITVVYSNGITRDYKIKGIFSTKYLFADIFAFVSQKEMESVLSHHGLASEIIVKIDKPGQEDKYIQEFRKIGLVDEKIKSWTEFTGAFGSITESFDLIKLILTLIGMLVATVTIFIVIFVNIVNRRKQIGIMKAIGTKEEIIIISYILQATLYSIIGIGLGLLIMHFLLIPYFEANPLDFPIGDVGLKITTKDLLISVIGLTFAAFIGSLVPALRGTKESILKSIWG